MFTTYKHLVADYVFSSKLLKEYDIQEQQTLSLAIEILTTHGVGGKFAESLLRHRYRLKDAKDIHGWDGYKGHRPIEIKTETINKSKKLNCEGSFSDHRDSTYRKSDMFLEQRPYLYSVGLDNVTGKCLYVMETDTKKIDSSSLLFERLNAKSPRISFAHWRYSRDSYKIVYVSELIRQRSNEIRNDLWDVLNKNLIKSEYSR